MLSKIIIKNFKAFGTQVEIRLNNLNIFSGLNSSGKSSLYQALLLFVQSYYNQIEQNDILLQALNLNGIYIDLGEEEEILFDKKNKKLLFSFEWNEGKTFTFEFELNSKTKKFLLVYSKYESYRENGSTKEKSMYEIFKKDEKWNIKAENLLNFSDPDISIALDKVFNKTKKKKRINYLNPIVEFTDISNIVTQGNLLSTFKINKNNIKNVILPEFKNRKKLDIEKFIENIEELIELRASLDKKDRFLMAPFNILYIPAFRGMPERVYLEGRNPLRRYHEEKNIKVKYDINLDTNEEYSGSLEDALNYWVAKKLKIAEKVIIKELVGNLVSEIFIKIGDKEIPINNVGFGTSQIIPVIANVLNSFKKQILIIDEPEIHLHPNLQSRLAEFFYKMSILNPNIILETHSEYLIEKLIYFKIKYHRTNYINMFWIDKNLKTNSSEIIEIKYDDYGYILNAPQDFLSEKTKIVEELQKIRLEKIENE